MKVPVTLSLYLGRTFIGSFLTILVGLLAVAYIGEMLELLRRASAHPEIGMGLVLRMAGLKLPGTAQIMLPSAILFSALYFFWRMTKTHELEIARSAGLSVWNFLGPVMVAALLLGIIDVTVINPLSAAMVGRFERMEDRYFRGRVSTLEISSAGIWISQADGGQQLFLHADSLKSGSFDLQTVIALENPADIDHSRRIDAASATLMPGAWELRDAYIHEPNGGNGLKINHQEIVRIPTELTQSKIEDSFASPKSMSFWRLPEFIHTLQAAGLSSVRHQLYFESLLAKPLFLAAMVALAAVFGLKQTRSGGILATIASGLTLGLLLFVLNDVIQTFAQSGGMPIALAAWGPALVGLFGGAAALFHFEDG